jgi:hypothetical protein
MNANMTGTDSGVAINEGIFLLEKLSPSKLVDLRKEYPFLSGDLRVGISAGPEAERDASVQDAIAREKAQIMIAALATAESAARKGLASVSRKVKSARRQRLISQIFVLIGSSSSLATLALGQNRAAVISAVLTLLAALGNLFADYQERLLNPQAGNIYDAFQRLSEGVYKTRAMSTDLNLALKYSQESSQIEQLVANANALCEELNSWLVQMVLTIPAQSPAGARS